MPEEPRRFFAPTDRPLRGTVKVPGDKSVSHRALLLGSVNEGPVKVAGFLRSADTIATLAAVRALGVTVTEEDDELVVEGHGWEGLREPVDVIDVGNAGTLIRLLPGLVAPLNFLCVITGDASIRRRPMARVLEPLALMGASVWGRDGNRLPPIAVRGGRLRGLTYRLPFASAQVKSCLLLAGLHAEGETRLVEPAPSRDHTERLLRYGGVQIDRTEAPGGEVVLSLVPCASLQLGPITVPGDLSSAAFVLVAALLVPGSRVTVTGVGLNPTRTGILRVLEAMGARLEVSESAGERPEPSGSITVEATELVAVDVGGEDVPLFIDEIPIWALAAARATGVSRLRGAQELRVKESDRLSAIAVLLRALGIDVRELEDGLDIVGQPQGWEGGAVASRGDHRLAMVGAVAGLASRRGVSVDDIDCISVSFPTFGQVLEDLVG